MPSLPHVTVVGAGAFGGWSALRLQERGCRVTLVDAWGAGNSRSSSGGETRVLRGVYGADRIYVQWVVRALAAWREAERRWRVRLFHPTGMLWLCGAMDDYVRASLPLLAEVGLAVGELSLNDARDRFPQIDFQGVQTVFFEETAGYLMARRACRAVAEALADAGGEVRRGEVLPSLPLGTRLDRVELSNGSSLAADVWVFACGPWLGSLLPEVVGSRVRPTRQEVYFFGAPGGFENFPVWGDLGDQFFYGIPGNEDRGFKIADDSRGEPFDPTSGDRIPTAAGIERARRYLSMRFPALAGAPLVEARVCQYENSPDGHFLIDRHPELENVWIAGGGSGHGFKLGPAVGELVAALVLGETEPPPLFRLDRPWNPESGGERIRTQFDSGEARSR